MELPYFNNGLCVSMILWDEAKNIKLQLERGISFEEIADIILRKEYLAILNNPTHENQMIFVIKQNNYVWAVPFLMEAQQNIVLKTAYPSRKLRKKFG